MIAGTVVSGQGQPFFQLPPRMNQCISFLMVEKAYLYPDADQGVDTHAFAVNPAGTDIGRQTQSGLSLPLDSVSRQHAQIKLQDGQWVLSDLKSSNGTYVNGEKINQTTLRDGDRITLGRANVTFRTANPDVMMLPDEKEASSGIRLVPDEEDSSIILSTQLSEKTPFKSNAVEKTATDHLDKLNQRLLALYQLSDILRGESRRDNILNVLMQLIFDNLPADRGVIVRKDDVTEKLVPELFKFRQGTENREFVLSSTVTRKALEEKVAVLIRDVRMDSRFQSSESMLSSDIRSAMCVPLAGKRDLMGLLFLDSRESIHAFTDDDLAFVSALATDAAMTLENLQLLEENIRQERLAAVGQTISELAHNIKNILQLARGGLELMEIAIKKKSFDDINTLWPITRRSLERMQALTQEMLDFSRQSKPRLRFGNVNDVLRHLVEIIQSDSRVSKVTISVQCDDDCEDVALDADGLNKALMNLLSNSFDALQRRSDATVWLSSEHHKGHVVIRVRDNGPGIPPDVLPRIFQPFFSTKGSQGNGLGLSMTRKYIEDMGGRLEVKSEPPNGCEFIISLPVVRQDQTVA